MNTLKETETRLKLKTLGRLNLEYLDKTLPLERKRSVQVELLILYLIINRDHLVVNSELIEVLWPEEKIDNPEGALRNLVYRARMTMKKVINDQETIISIGGGYSWNTNIKCEIDYEELIKIAKMVEQEIQPIRKYGKCLNMLAMYQADFLSEYNYRDWVVYMNNRLQSTCLEAMLKTLNLLSTQGKYHEILNITNHPNASRIMDTRIYEIKLYAYYQTGKMQEGIEFYRQTVDRYYSKYGLEVSPRLKDIYTMIINMPTKQLDVEGLARTLKNDESSEHTFYCDFDVFKNIYQVNVRSARRSMKARILVLLTLEDTSNLLMDNDLQMESVILKEVIMINLRKNDVFSKFNMMQYSLIVASPDINGAQKAVDRIEKKYLEKRKHKEVILKYELKDIR